MKNIIFHFTLICMSGLISLTDANGQEKEIQHHDYLMPKKGHSMVELYSGIPYVAIGQYSYGFSDRFSVGVLYGHTPEVLGYGIRIKSVIAQPSESTRITLKSPFIYYPAMKGHESWVLAWPTLNMEWKLKNEARVWAGVGLLGAACTEWVLGKEGKEEMSDLTRGTGTTMMKKESMAELWNTIQIGYSKPISNKCSYVIEFAPIMKGFKFTTPHGLIDGLPAVVTLGFSFSL